MKKKKDSYKPYRPVPAKIANGIMRGLDRFGTRTLAQDEEKLIAKARKKTGIHDFGDDSFREPLHILCELTRKGKTLTAAGRILFKIVLQEILENKLMINDQVTRHPEIHEIEIRKPIFIGGLPRTGSTYLHHLLAQDPANRAPLHWETYAPVPPPEPATYETDPRIKKGQQIWSLLYYVAPDMRAVHESSGDSPEECFFLMKNDLISWWFNVLTGDEYLDFLLRQDFTLSYRLHKRQLQILQWKFPQRTWVLKTPSHLYGLGELLNVYPDARFIHLHRNLLEVFPSISSLYTKVRGAFFEEVDPEAIGAEWFDLGLKYIERGIAAREKEEQRKDSKALFHDILYPDLVADPMGTVEKIYGAFGIDLSEEAAARMKRYVAANPQNKHGKHHYSLEEYGLDEKKIRERYGPYYERFGLSWG